MTYDSAAQDSLGPLQSACFAGMIALEAAVALHRSGQLEKARAAYAAILAAEPDHAQVLHYCGLLEHE